jgi:hypothetical protein
MIIQAWKGDWNNRFPRASEERLYQFNALLKTFKKYGYEYPDDITEPIITKIVNATVCEGYHNKQSLKTWSKINYGLLQQSIIKFFNLVELEKGELPTSVNPSLNLPERKNQKPKLSDSDSSAFNNEEDSEELMHKGKPLPSNDMIDRPALDLSSIPHTEVNSEFITFDDFLNEIGGKNE